MLGSSVVEALERDRPEAEILAVTRDVIDLRDRASTLELLASFRPDVIVHAAARVGGIALKLARPTSFLLDNLLMDSSVISGAIELRVPELVYISSAVIYPERYERPFRESDIMTGRLEPANEGYGLAKTAALTTCAYASREYGLHYRAAVPSNLYGPNDHFDLGGAHLIAAALAKVDAAKRSGAPSVSVWGDGTARREFVFSEDLAGWLVSQLGSLAAWPEWLNLGSGSDRSVADYYRTACEVVGYEGELEFDPSKPAGVPRRMLDSSAAMALGWNPSTDLKTGMSAVYAQLLNASRTTESD